MDLNTKEIFGIIVSLAGSPGIISILNNVINTKNMDKKKYDAAVRLIGAFEKNNDHLLQIEYQHLFKKLPPQPHIIRYLLSQPGKFRNLLLYEKCQHSLNWNENSLQIRNPTFIKTTKLFFIIMQAILFVLLFAITIFVVHIEGNNHFQNMYNLGMWAFYAIFITITGIASGKELNAIQAIEELAGKL
jgi:hypothetical protein